jgi:uncharacterized protein (DUF2062 family)
MPRRFFRKFAFKRHHMSQQWFMTPFRHLLHDHRLWGIRRQCVVPAFATGLFVAFLPFPGHMLISALAALALRINIPVAAVTTWVSNPLTVGPMFYFAYRLGVVILDLPPQPFEMELSVLLGSAAALLGYIVLDLLWRLSIGNYKARKRNLRRDAGSD